MFQSRLQDRAAQDHARSSQRCTSKCRRDEHSARSRSKIVVAARNEGGFQPPKVIEFVLQVRGIKELVAEETVYDFSPVRKSAPSWKEKKWQPVP